MESVGVFPAQCSRALDLALSKAELCLSPKAHSIFFSAQHILEEAKNNPATFKQLTLLSSKNFRAFAILFSRKIRWVEGLYSCS